MKEYYGNYLGIVVSGGDQDPDHRCRCQVFIPHIMPALDPSFFSENGEEIKDTFIQVVGTNLENSFTSKQIETLKKMLPWAECAAPIIGAGPSFRVTSDGQASETRGNTGFNVDINGVDSPLPAVQLPNSTGSITTNSDGSISVPGLNVVNDIIPGRTYGQSATANAKPFSNIVIHDPGSTNITTQNLINYVQSYDSDRGGTFGYHLIIDKDGTVHQTAPWNARTNHVLAADTKSTGYSWVQNNNSLGISLMGESTDYTQAQKFALQSIIESSGIRNIYGHGEISDNKMATEGIIAKQMRLIFGNADELLATPPGVTPAGGDEGGKAADGRAGTSTQGKVADEVTNATSTGSTQYAGNVENMDPKFRDQYNRVYGMLDGSKFIDTVPDDGDYYGIYNGTKEEWAHFFTRMAAVESDFDSSASSIASGGEKSIGIYQMGEAQYEAYGGANHNDKNDATKTFINYAEGLYFGDGKYGLKGGINSIASEDFGGISAGYGPLQKSVNGNWLNDREPWLLAENMTSAEQLQNVSKQQDTQYPAVKRDPVTNETVAFGSSFGMDANYQATGMFGYARAGQLVWCFFREGNPMFPVYFAASYGAEEYARVRQASSPGEMEEGFDSTVINLQAGGIRSAQTFQDSNKSGLGNDMAFEIYSKMGHNFRMGTDTVELNSLYNFRQQTEGDHYNITLQNRETRTMGDANTVVGQDCYVTIGNWDADAMEAAEELQKIVNEAMEIGDEE
jgi:hypothetical protein